MVQVDVFWSYAIGSSFALGASHQLVERARRRQAGEASPVSERSGGNEDRGWREALSNPYLAVATLFLALLFAPSGAYLLWEFPSWETMHAGDRTLPAWLVALFASTNTLLGVAGFLVTQALLRSGRTFGAALQAAGGYLGMFFILVHGWDGEGYQRFFSPTEADYLGWDGDWSAFLTSDVAITLYVMGAVLLPPMLLIIASWLREGWRTAGVRSRIAAPLLIPAVVGGVAGVPLATAVATSLLIHALGPVPGVAIVLALLWPLVLRRGSVARKLVVLFELPRDAEAYVGAPVRSSPFRRSRTLSR